MYREWVIEIAGCNPSRLLLLEILLVRPLQFSIDLCAMRRLVTLTSSRSQWIVNRFLRVPFAFGSRCSESIGYAALISDRAK